MLIGTKIVLRWWPPMHHFPDFKAFAKELYPRVGGVRFNQLKTILLYCAHTADKQSTLMCWALEGQKWAAALKVNSSV